MTDREVGLAERQLRRMWDDACIRKLAHEYADAVLVGDAARMASLWAADVEPATPPDFDHRWAQPIHERWQEWGVTMLHITTQAVWFDGDEHAQGRVQCLVQLDSAKSGFVEQSIMYEDDYVRRGAGWLFARRSHRLWFGANRTPDPLTREPAGWPAGIVGSGTLERDLAAVAERRDVEQAARRRSRLDAGAGITV